eukprot:jgi/Botrbrau1/13249/Bobra.0199s0016.1
MGRGVMDVGPQERAASVVKLVGNSFIVGFAELVAETLTLGEANGVPPAFLAGLMTEMFPGPIPQAYVGRIAEGNYAITEGKPGFRLAGGMKDIGYAIRLAQETGMTLPIGEIAMSHLRDVEQRGGGDLDFVALALPIRESADLPIPEDLLKQ